MNEKYYTPSISEFHVGFEYESLGDPRMPEKDDSWNKEVMTEEHFPDFLRYWKDGSDSEWRVKYLDSADIESLGWKLIGGNIYELDGHYLYNDYALDKSISIYEAESDCLNRDENEPVLSHATVRNRSELRKLMSMLGINSK